MDNNNYNDDFNNYSSTGNTENNAQDNGNTENLNQGNVNQGNLNQGNVNQGPESYNPYAYNPYAGSSQATNQAAQNAGSSGNNYANSGSEYVSSNAGSYQQNAYQQNAGANGAYQQNAGQNTNGAYQQNAGQNANRTYQQNAGPNGAYRQNPYGSTYNPAGNTAPRTKKVKKSGKSSLGKKLGTAAAVAAVFGMVSGTVFCGVNNIGNKLLSKNSTSESTGSTESGSVSDSSTASSSVATTSTGYASDLTDVSAIVEEVMPSIVAITNTATVTYQSFWGQSYSQDSTSCGSGIIIDEDDTYLYVATNNHVVADAESLTVQFSNDTVVDAEVRGTYSNKDLAVVQVKLSDIDSDTLAAIKVATVGDSSTIKVGQAAIAIGNALGYGQSVTTGIISATGRTITVSDSSTGATTTNSNLLQTDAAINPGNSGGALLNQEGQVIGINSAKYSSTDVEGVGYAIPMEDAYPIIQALIQDGSYYDTNSAYIGITGVDVSSQYAQMYNMPEGVYVYSVTAGSGAEAAKLQQGDIITAIDGNEALTMDELKSLLTGYKAGDTVTITYYRQQGKGYQEATVDVQLMSADQLNIQQKSLEQSDSQ